MFLILNDIAVVYLFCLYTNTFSSPVTLSPTNGAVIENESLNLMCSYDGTDQVSSSRWSYSAASTNPVIIVLDGNCVAAGFLNNSALYKWTCHGNNSFSLTIKKVERKNHGETWKCRQGNSESNTVTIYVIVPASKVQITMPTKNITTVSEKSNVQFVCNASSSRPGPKLKWFISSTPSALDIAEIFDNVTQFNTTDDVGLVYASGILIYEPDRSVNTWFIYCKATNVRDRQVKSNMIQLNVTYAPDGPPTIKGIQNNTKYFVIENTKGQLICISTGGNPKANLTWSCFNETSILYSNYTTVSSEVTWTASRKYTGICKCDANHSETEASTVVARVEVLYPPMYPMVSKNNTTIPISSPINIIINNTIVLFCNTSSNPKPTLSWIYADGRENNGSTILLPRFDFKDEGKYVCMAVNIMFDSNGKNVSGSNSTEVDLVILYPPTTPSFRYQQVFGTEIGNGSLKVVIGDTFKIACNSSARPDPTYSWRWNDTITENQLLILTSLLSDQVATCIVMNTMNETLGESRDGMAKADLIVHVLYPPKAPTITLQIDQNNEENVSDVIKVIENSPFTLKCKTNSKPAPYYSWYGSFTSTTSDLVFKGLSRDQAETYSCYSFNEMERTFGSKEKGENSTNIKIHVLYAPEIGSLQARIAIERSSINITCPVINGNPRNMSVYWKRDDTGQIWKGSNLLINEVLRNDTAEYTCNVNNMMEPTVGESIAGRNSKSFSLDVLYKASVKGFFVKGHHGLNPVFLEENTSAELNCILESHPKPNATIYFMTNILSTQKGALSLSYLHNAVSCEHSGVYKCTGINVYNYGTPSQKYLTINIRCFPRPSPYVETKNRFFIKVQDRVTMSFTAVAYPIPGEDDYKWRKYVGSVWRPITNNNDYIIESSGLQSNLTILAVEQADFGTYRLEIQNSIGIFEQIFTIGPKVKPEPPTEFKYWESSITETSFTVSWKPGLDGGYPQTFTLRYRRSSERKWTTIFIPGRIDALMNYTLSNLEGSSDFEVEIYSVNKFGESTYSNTLRIRTKGNISEESNTTYGIIAGSVAAIVAIFVVVTVVIIIVRRRRSGNLKQQQEHVRSEQCHVLRTNQQQDAKTDLDGDYEEIGEGVTSKGEHYEKLKSDTGPLHPYQEVDISNVQQNSLEQPQTCTQTKIGKAGQIVRYVREMEAENKTKAQSIAQNTSVNGNDIILDDYVNLKL